MCQREFRPEGTIEKLGSWSRIRFGSTNGYRSSHPGRVAFKKRDPALRTWLLLSLCPSGTDFSAQPFTESHQSPITSHFSLLIVFPALSALTAFQSLPPYLRRQTHMFFELIRQVEGRVKSEYLSDFSN